MDRPRRWLLHVPEEGTWPPPDGQLRPDGETFIHCAYADQLEAVVGRHVPTPEGRVILVIDRQRLDAPVVDENLQRGRDLHPHVYGVIPQEAVVAVHPLCVEADGRVALPRPFPPAIS